MPIPGETITVLDPGLGLVEPAVSTPLVYGVSSTGTADVLVSVSTLSAARTEWGQGPLVEEVCRCLSEGGGPVLGMRSTGTTAGAAGAVTPGGGNVGTGTVTVAGAAFDAYEVMLEVTTTGDAGVGAFIFSLDDGRTYSEELTIPVGLAYAIPSTNLTLTFVPGVGPVEWSDGDVHQFDCTAPMYTTADLATSITALTADSTEWQFMILTGLNASGADAATMFGAVETHMATFAAAFRYVRCMMDAGNEATGPINVALDAVSDNRILVSYRRADVASAKAFAGFGTPQIPLVGVVGARAHKALISTDLARVASGSLTGVAAIEHDERLTEVMDSHRITTARTWLGRAGFYLTNGRLKSDAGSDFRYWQHGVIMDLACRTTYIQQQTFIGMGIRTNADGTIDERDAVRLETRVREALKEQLLRPTNAEGTSGHVSDLNYTIDRTNNIATTETLLSDVAIRPLGYAKFITTTLGYSLAV